MVYKLLIVMLALLVLDTSTQRLNRFQDLYKYDFMNHQGKRQYTDYFREVTPSPNRHKCDDKTCNNHRTPPTVEILNVESMITPKSKRVWAELNLMNLLQDLPREEISETVIFVPEEFDYDQKTE